MTDLSIIIPAYNEAENLRLLLPHLSLLSSKLGAAVDIMVIDRRIPCEDTRQICHANGVMYLNRSESDHYGAAMRCGIAHAKGRYIACMDADGSHSPEFIAELYAHANHADIVIASRYIAGGGSRNHALLILQSRMLNLIYSHVLSLHCSDISNSFRLYSGNLLRALTLECQHFDIVEEILVRSAVEKPDLHIREIPFMFEPRVYGKTKRNYWVLLPGFILTLIRLSAIRYRARTSRSR